MSDSGNLAETAAWPFDLPSHASDRVSREALKALQDRPSISIRSRISVAFILLFVLSSLASLTMLVTLHRISQKLRFLEAAGNYTFEIQQARRYEKNYLLYGKNLADALDNVEAARTILVKEADNIKAVVGPASFKTMEDHLLRYEKLLSQLEVLNGQARPGEPAAISEIESGLRKHGAEMVSVAQELLGRERAAVNAMLAMSMRYPVAYLLILMALLIYIGSFLTRQILMPISRFVNYTQRISQGNFSPIRPARRYRDEFSNLAVAINLMLAQLKQHQDHLLQTRKMVAVGNLTAGIAHELNNPLNNISITTEALLDEFEEMSGEEKKKLLHTIFDQTERASSTVRNLLDFTRMEQPSFVSLDIREILGTTLRLSQNEMKINRITLHTDYHDPLPAIMGDFSQLQQVFLNLILNAIAAMPQGGTLTITVEPAEETFVRVDMTDTGMGIPESNLPHIFDPFFTTKEVGKGTGLGLTVGYNIIQKHKGRIEVKSEVNVGTTFSVLIPAAPGAP